VSGGEGPAHEDDAPVNDPALPLLCEVRFREDYRCFRAGQVLRFDDGVNLLVGERGSGKSTLITLLRDRVGNKFKAELSHRVMDVVMQACYVRWLDFEKDNPRTQAEIGIHDAFLLGSMSVSHGQTTLAMLNGLQRVLQETPGRTLLLLDEPDTALSIRSVHHLARLLRRAADDGHQVIAAVHNPIVIASQPRVLCLDDGEWMSSERFIAEASEPPRSPGGSSR
jgi:predicted ATPase